MWDLYQRPRGEGMQLAGKLRTSRIRNKGQSMMLNPSFSADETHYTADIPADLTSVTVSAIANSDVAYVNGNGVYDLAPGEKRTIPSVVTAEDGSTKTYSVDAYRRAIATLTVTDMNNIKAVLPVSAAFILVGISMALTLIAGLIPSRIASKKDPVEALRSE